MNYLRPVLLIFSVCLIKSTCQLCTAAPVAEEDTSIISLVHELNLPQNTPFAVLPFSEDNKYTDNGRLLAEKLILELKKAGIQIVERELIKNALSEIALSQTGITETELQTGKIVSAKYLITGTLVSAFGQKSLFVKVTNVENSEIEKSALAVISQKTINQISAQLLTESTSSSAYLFRSLLVPGWGQFYAQRKLKGTIASTVCLGSLCSFVFTSVASRRAYNDYDYFSTLSLYHKGEYSSWLQKNGLNAANGYAPYLEEVNRKKNIYIQKRNVMYITAAVTGCLWSWNVIDAVITGRKNSKKIELYFSSSVNNTHEVSFVYNF